MLPRVAKAAELLELGIPLVGLEPTRLCLGRSAPPIPYPGLLLLRRLEGYHRQFADRVELFRHWHMLVFAPNARSLVTGDRVGNPLGHIAGK